jgi:Na+/melibiose symporter-like transporter
MISCIPLCGSFLGGAIVPSMYEKNRNFGEAFRVGFLLCIGGLILVLVLITIDYRMEKHDSELLEKYVDEKRKAKIAKGIPLREKKAVKTFKQGQDMSQSFNFEDVKELSAPFWLTCFSCMCTYIGIINSLIIGSSVLQTRFNFSEVEAGFYFTLPYVVAAFCSPICGLFVEKYGKRMTLNLLGSALMVIAHIYLISLPDCEKCL